MVRPPRSRAARTLWMAVFLAALGSGCEGTKEPPPAAPNLILISVDTLRADHLGCYGYKEETSPTIDGFAAEGTLFLNASATSPWTAPSHGSMFTGRYPSRHGLRTFRNRLDDDVRTLTEILHDAGYATAAIVGAPTVDRGFGFDRGFDHFERLPDRPHLEPTGAVKAGIEWLENRKESRPFFLFLHLFDIHSPYGAEDEQANLLVEPYAGKITGDSLQLLAARKGTVPIDAADLAFVTQLYDAAIYQMDRDIGRFRAHLEAGNLLEDTIVVITADHGEEFYERGGFLHAYSHYQELIHVPLILRGPGVPADQRITGPVSLIDIMPTLLPLLGLSDEENVDGYDLRALWDVDAGAEFPARTIFSEADQTNEKPGIRRSARRGRYKLHYDLHKRETKLFDLERDSGETENIATTTPHIHDSLFADLKRFMMEPEATTRERGLTDEEIEELRQLGYVEGSGRARPATKALRD